MAASTMVSDATIAAWLKTPNKKGKLPVGKGATAEKYAEWHNGTYKDSLTVPELLQTDAWKKYRPGDTGASSSGGSAFRLNGDERALIEKIRTTQNDNANEVVSLFSDFLDLHPQRQEEIFLEVKEEAKRVHAVKLRAEIERQMRELQEKLASLPDTSDMTGSGRKKDRKSA